MNLDVVIRQAEIFPGDEPARKADVGLVGQRIAALAPVLDTAGAAQVVEAEGLMLCPGFIDMHAHSALKPFQEPDLSPKIAQGFTTEVINPDGLSPAPVTPECWTERREYLQALEGPGPASWNWTTMADYFDALDRTRPATTLIPSVGHNAVRSHVMGDTARPPTAVELEAMRREVRAGFEAGARSLSFGLIYLPGMFAATDELVALAAEAAPYNAPLIPHVRNEAGAVLEAVGEMIDVARRSGAPLHVSHLKVVGHSHLADPLLELIDRAARDIDITFDQYPYGAGSTLLTALLPPWAQEGGPRSMVARLQQKSQRQQMRRDAEEGITGWENLYASCGAENIAIAQAAVPRAGDAGKTLAVIAAERSCDPFDAALDLLVDTHLDVAMVDHYATEETVRTIFRHPRALVGSDGIFGAHPHPRLYGTAARVLGRYALREGLIPVEEAVARLTARPADRLQLQDRGRIREGLRADLVLLDPTRYTDTATYSEPMQLPPGVERVFVAGETVWIGGMATGRRPGGVLAAALPRTSPAGAPPEHQHAF